MHVGEILGSVLPIFFVIFTIVFSKFLWVDAIAPLWFAVVFTVLFGAASIWICVKVGAWWYYKLKEYFGRKKN